VRRHRFTGELSFYRCHSTRPVTLADLVHIICTRCRVEGDFQLAKGATGLDQGQTICWNSRMRWRLISNLATAVLAVTHARGDAVTRPWHKPATSAGTTSPPSRPHDPTTTIKSYSCRD
jgi:hypothetical protein